MISHDGNWEENYYFVLRANFTYQDKFPVAYFFLHPGDISDVYGIYVTVNLCNRGIREFPEHF